MKAGLVWSNHRPIQIQFLHWCLGQLGVQLGGKLPGVAGLQKALHLLVLGDHRLMVNGHRIIHLEFRSKDILLECRSGSIRPKGPWFWDQVEVSCHLLPTSLLCQVLFPGFLDAGLGLQNAGFGPSK